MSGLDNLDNLDDECFSIKEIEYWMKVQNIPFETVIKDANKGIFVTIYRKEEEDRKKREEEIEVARKAQTCYSCGKVLGDSKRIKVRFTPFFICRECCDKKDQEWDEKYRNT